MSKVTSKLQVTIPKALARRYGIRPGDRVLWEELPRGAVMVRVRPGAEGPGTGGGGGGGGVVGEGGSSAAERGHGLLTWRDFSPEERAARLEEADRRVDAAQTGRRTGRWTRKEDRGWTREDLHGDRGRPR